LGDLVSAGTFKPLIDRVYALNDIVEAYTYVDSGQKVGNVLLRLED
jgi:NADPH:quinone reductase-like Zn-dependent oxidoreductase